MSGPAAEDDDDDEVLAVAHPPRAGGQYPQYPGFAGEPGDGREAPILRQRRLTGYATVTQTATTPATYLSAATVSHT